MSIAIADTLLAELERRGCAVYADCENLRIRPKLNDAELLSQLRMHKAQLLELVRRANDAEFERAREFARQCEKHNLDLQSELEVERLARADGYPTPAQLLMKTCVEHGVGLRLDPDGTLVVESHGRAWRALVKEIENHVEEIAALIEEGWQAYDAGKGKDDENDMPRTGLICRRKHKHSNVQHLREY